MNRNYRITSNRRSGFTLVEILVVIAIIAVLASLILGGVMAFMRKGPEVQNRNDILQISSAMQKFYADYKFYPPDRIRLCSNRSQYGATPLDVQSLACIGHMFPSLPGNFTKIWWDGKAHPNGTNLDFTLEGDQALVFFLGGPPNGASTPALMGGFSTNPTDPVDVANVAPNRKKHMDFDLGRLQLVARAGNNAAANFPSYLDSYKKIPFVFFQLQFADEWLLDRIELARRGSLREAGGAEDVSQRLDLPDHFGRGGWAIRRGRFMDASDHPNDGRRRQRRYVQFFRQVPWPAMRISDVA